MPRTAPPYNPGRKIRRICSELGPEYKVRSIDNINIIFGQTENGDIVEIRGLDNVDAKIEAEVKIMAGDTLKKTFLFNGDSSEELAAKIAKAGKAAAKTEA